MLDNGGTVTDMASNLPPPAPGFYEGKFDGLIYEVREGKAGTWYAMLLYRAANGAMRTKYIGHKIRLGERIEL